MNQTHIPCISTNMQRDTMQKFSPFFGAQSSVPQSSPAGFARFVGRVSINNIPGLEPLDDVTSSELARLGVVLSSSGQPITITVQSDGTLLVDTARVLQGDIRAANGVVHMIDQVLIPPTQ